MATYARLTLIRLDHAGLAEVLKSNGLTIRAEVHQLAEGIAADVRAAKGQIDVVVDDYVTDRVASSVTIRDVRGMAWQARDGILTRAAASRGLEVRDRLRRGRP